MLPGPHPQIKLGQWLTALRRRAQGSDSERAAVKRLVLTVLGAGWAVLVWESQTQARVENLYLPAFDAYMEVGGSHVLGWLALGLAVLAAYLPGLHCLQGCWG